MRFVTIALLFFVLLLSDRVVSLSSLAARAFPKIARSSSVREAKRSEAKRIVVPTFTRRDDESISARCRGTTGDRTRDGDAAGVGVEGNESVESRRENV